MKVQSIGIDSWIEFMQVPVQVKGWGHKTGKLKLINLKLRYKGKIRREESLLLLVLIKILKKK